MIQPLRYLCVLFLLTLGGCQAYHLPLPQPEPPPDTPEPGLAGYAKQLATLDSTGRSEALLAAEAEWQATGDARARARLGLARGQWGHSGYDPQAAAGDLEAALVDEDADWPAHERAFLSLRTVQLEHAIERRQAHANVIRENRRLRRALDDAERKLRALSEIEEQIGP